MINRIGALAAVVAVTALTLPVAATATPAPLDWRPCGNHAQCATLTVPLDWANPRGATINLALSKVAAADPSRRIGTLLINPGGPGGAGAEGVAWDADSLPAQLRDRFDLVGFDPRGVGQSVPAVSCSRPVFDPAVTQFPTTQAQFDRLVAHNRAVGEDCLRKTGPLLAHLDTISVARDLEATRQALGEAKLNFLGLSYGSLIGASYAQLYPTHVRAMVLDGPVDHSVGSIPFVADENAASEVSLRHFFAWCDKEPACALHGRSSATYDRLSRVATQGPLAANGIPGGSPAEVVLQGVYALLNVTSSWPDLAAAIQQAVDGDASKLAFTADNGPNSPDDPNHVWANQTYLSIACQDFPSDIRTFGQLRQQIDQAARTSPHLAGHVEGWLIQAGCIGWPVAAADPWQAVPVPGASPILVVAGKYDPATPYAWGVGLARQISGSVLLTRSSDGHTGLFNDDCAVQREADYLADPAAPVGTCP